MEFTLVPFILLAGTPVITEVAPNPADETTGEFVEIFNPSEDPAIVTGFSMTDGDALDYLVPWDPAQHGAFPHSEAVTGTDTIPPQGFALVFELDYATAPCYDIPPGTVILTTADHSICNGLAASSDPLTLFDSTGTTEADVLSTYGTPFPSDNWEDRDDDGLDNIPWDPGDEITIQRYPWSADDQEGSWIASEPGGTPGAHAPPPPDTVNVSCDSVWTDPASPPADQPFQTHARFTCLGNCTPDDGFLIIFQDRNGDSTASPEEILVQQSAAGLQPDSSITVSAWTTLDQGWYLHRGQVQIQDDQQPQDDDAAAIIPVGGGIDPVITEVLCNPLDEDRGEFIEIHYPGPGIYPLAGCRFTDGDALDDIVPWTLQALQSGNAVYSAYLPEGRYAIVIDPEYETGTQEYQLAESTYVFTVANTTIGNGLTGTDPITLYDFSGTDQSHVSSTYGTPLKYDDPLLCDDDGLDAIPFDPGEFISIQRKSSALPDEEYCWAVSPEGGTPGGPAVFSDTTDTSLDTLLLNPSNPAPGQTFQITTIISNTGTVTAHDIQLDIFLDNNADSTAQPEELLSSANIDSLLPYQTDTTTTAAQAPSQGRYLAAAAITLTGDSNPDNNLIIKGFRTGEGIPAIITEVLCNPENEDTDEFIEIYYPGPGVLDITGCAITDGDAVDQLQPWDPASGDIQSPGTIFSPYIPEASFAVILDSEYPQGTLPYDLQPGTIILTTSNTTLGDGISSNDPITLYDSEGTQAVNVMSTYGTPVDSDEPLMRDDDGLDDIPRDPGEGLSMQRKQLEQPDTEDNWFAPDPGPTPGGPPPPIQEGPNARITDLQCLPPMGPEGTLADIYATVTNTGTESIYATNLNILFFQDTNQNSQPETTELIATYPCSHINPGDTTIANCVWSTTQSEMQLFALADCQGDSFPGDDTLTTWWNSPGPIRINEIMYSPSPGEPEWIELTNTGLNTINLINWTIEDSNENPVIFATDTTIIQPDSFIIVTSDSADFRQCWPAANCPILQPPSWPALNNSTQQSQNWADIITLRDNQQTPADYVPYDDDWGGDTGTSLEKTQPTLPGYSPSSWTSCTIEGTPGTTNSCTSQQQNTGRFLYYHPDPFSPDGDGQNDILTIEMNTQNQENTITLEIYNVQGRCVITILKDHETTQSHTATWDGTDSNGQPLPVGRYIVFLSARNTETGELHEDCGVVILARRL